MTVEIMVEPMAFMTTVKSVIMMAELKIEVGIGSKVDLDLSMADSKVD
jgi:hypothetical protein